MSFYRERSVRSTRKQKQCIGCLRIIPVGSYSLGVAGHWEGDFWSGAYHTECRAAEIALNSLHDVYPGEWMGLNEIEWDDWDWLLTEHPIAAANMAITKEMYDEALASSERMRAFYLSRAHPQ